MTNLRLASFIILHCLKGAIDLNLAFPSNDNSFNGYQSYSNPTWDLNPDHEHDKVTTAV